MAMLPLAWRCQRLMAMVDPSARRLGSLCSHVVAAGSTSGSRSGGATRTGSPTQLASEYHAAASRLLEQVCADATTVLADVARRAVRCLRAGGRVWANYLEGHMAELEIADDREGNPQVFGPLAKPVQPSAQLFLDRGGAEPPFFAEIRSGDVLLTNTVNRTVQAQRDANGVFVIVFTSPYIDQPSAPRGRVLPNQDDLMPEDVASQVVDSYAPWDQGLVRVPERPDFPVLPSSSSQTAAIHWMLSAEAAHALATGTEPDGRAAQRWAEVLRQRLRALPAQLEGIRAVGATIAERLIG